MLLQILMQGWKWSKEQSTRLKDLNEDFGTKSTCPLGLLSTPQSFHGNVIVGREPLLVDLVVLTVRLMRDELYSDYVKMVNV